MNWVTMKVVSDVHPLRGEWADAISATTFRLWADDRLRYERETRHSNPSRLPHLSRHLGFEIEVERPEAPNNRRAA